MAVVVSVVVLGLSAGAFAGCTSGSQISLSVHPSIADRGDTVTIASGIHNTTSHSELVTIKYQLKYSNTTTSAFLGQVTFPIAAGKSISETRTFTIPTAAPLGAYSVKANAFASGVGVGSCSALLSLVANDGD
jgi:hypothetical protein